MIDSREINVRVRRIHDSMDEAGINALFVSSPRNVQYLTGKEVGRVLLTNHGDFLWTKDLYAEIYSPLYSEKDYPFDVFIFEKGAIKERIRKEKIRKLFVEDIGYDSFLSLGKDLKVRLETTDVVERQRMVKTPVEIELLKKSCNIAVKGMRRAREVIKPGVKESLALSEIEYFIRKNDSDSPPFDDGMLLASGKDSADVHARAKSKKMQSGTTAVVDLGARYCGYYSDMTRTLKIGKVDKDTVALLEFVDNLKDTAIDMLRPGVVAGDVHKFVESEIEKRGLKFYHSTGHGVGLNIHELPTIGKDSKDVLEENMVFTIEPGIYLANEIGVRFEDTVILKRNKAEVLTRFP